jgi:hypothetical protein
VSAASKHCARQHAVRAAATGRSSFASPNERAGRASELQGKSRDECLNVLGEIAKQKWTGQYPNRKSVNGSLVKLKLRCSLSARREMLRGKEISTKTKVEMFCWRLCSEGYDCPSRNLNIRKPSLSLRQFDIARMMNFPPAIGKNARAAIGAYSNPRWSSRACGGDSRSR